MTFAEGSGEGSRAGDSFLEVQGGVVRFCGEGFSTGDWEDVVRDWDRSYCEGPESAESSSVNGTPDTVAHRQKCVGRELAGYSSCSSSNSRCHVIRVGREGLGLSIYSWAE